MTAASDASASGDLGTVDALVQSSFAVQGLLAEVAASRGLSITQLRLLGVLRDREPRMAALADHLGLSRQSVTGLIDRAERRGLVRRVSIPVGDERAVHVSLTDVGRALGGELAADATARVRALVDELSSENLRRLSRLLSRIVARDMQLRGSELGAEDVR